MSDIAVDLQYAQKKSFRESFKIFKELSKSGIVALVLISVTGGYFLGHSAEVAVSWPHFLLTLLGIMLLASGSSALNQIQEQHIDRLMPRTSTRPLPSGRLSPWSAWFFVIFCLFFGVGILFAISWSTAVLGLAAVIFYNGLYTMWWKPQMAFAAIPGAVPGALPILMGYVAAGGGTWDAAGIYLFFILFFWQMPHFWALAIRFRRDYVLGGIPTLPASKGIEVTHFQIIIWSFCYIALLLIAPFFFSTSALYLAVTIWIGYRVLKELRGFVYDETGKSWIRYFLWVNFSLIIAIAALCVDVWRYHLFQPLFTLW